MSTKTSKTRLVADRLSVVTQRVNELTDELEVLTQEKQKLEITLEVLGDIGRTPIKREAADIAIPDTTQETKIPKKVIQRARAGVTDSVITMLKNSDTGMTYLQIVDELGKDGEVKKASLTATLCRLIKQDRLVRVDNVYLIND